MREGPRAKSEPLIVQYARGVPGDINETWLGAPDRLMGGQVSHWITLAPTPKTKRVATETEKLK